MTKTYQIESDQSYISFSVKHMMFTKVHGKLERITGTFSYNTQDILNSSVEVEIDLNSINTNQIERDNHLKSADFFNVKKYPTIFFRSTRFEKQEGDLIISGDLTIHGITRPIRLEMQFPSDEIQDKVGNFKISISGKASIKRRDFGLNWSAALEAGGILVGDDISIKLQIQLDRKE
jgi:polyisoprenoid-binding protein YceI